MNNILEKWHPLERMWLIVAPLIILFCNLCVTEHWENITSSVCGIIFVILCAKGKWHGFIFGLIHCLLYGFLSLGQGLYSEAFLKICFTMPLHAIAMYKWLVYTCPRTDEVIHQNLKTWEWYKCLGMIAFFTYCLGFILNKLGGAQPYLDAFTTIGSIYGAILMLKRCGEMWWIFFLVNVASVWMWFNEYLTHGNHLSILIMWIIWTINSIWGWWRWQKT